MDTAAVSAAPAIIGANPAGTDPMKSILAAVVLLSLAGCNPPQARQVEAAKPAEPEAVPAPEPAPVKVDARSLARETLAFLETVAENATSGVQARDAEGIDNSVEVPAFRLVKQWSEVSLPESESFSGCRDGANAAMILAGDLTAARDSLERRKSIVHGAAEFDQQIELCRQQVSATP